MGLQNTNLQKTILGNSGLPIYRLGLSATYRPGKKTIYRAIDEGVNYFFGFGIDTQLTRVLKDVMKGNRERFVVSTGAYNLIIGHPNLRRSLEKRLRQFNTDYIDAFLFLGVTKEKEFPESVRYELYRFKDEGKIRSVGISTHDRKFAGKLAAEGKVDTLMIRYNAAHRGAEQDIFPYLEKHNPAVVGYTATRWTYLLRRPKGWQKDGMIPNAGQCYRFVLSNPNINVCLTAPRNEKELVENIQSLRQGPLDEEDMAFMKRFGDAVYHTKKWLM